MTSFDRFATTMEESSLATEETGQLTTSLLVHRKRMNPHQFVASLSELKFDNAFNPYTSRCDVHDVDDAPQRRRTMLLAVLTVAVTQDVDSIWIGRDLGYRGGRRTGLALTDDAHTQEYAARWGVHFPRTHARSDSYGTDGGCHLAGSVADQRTDFPMERVSLTPSRTGKTLQQSRSQSS